VNSGLPCQDAHGWFVTEELAVIAVADGAGSASLSHFGSAVAVRAALTRLIGESGSAAELRAGDLGTHLRAAVLTAIQAVEEAAIMLEAGRADLATTLIVVVAGPDFVGAAQVGDGAVVVNDCNSNLIALTTPFVGEYVNETSFITSPNCAEVAQVNVRGLVPAHLAVFTDGLQMVGLKMPVARPHGPFFRPLFQHIAGRSGKAAERGIERFLKSPRLADRTDDDLTLVLAHLRTP
jgi:hypothetical protein